MAVKERIGKKGVVIYYYDFMIDGKRYRKTIGRNKQKAERAEARRRLEVEAGSDVAPTQPGSNPSIETERPDSSPGFIQYAETEYLQWSMAHKKTWQEDVYHLKTLRDFFGDRTFEDIAPALLDEFMVKRLNTPTKHDQQRSPTSVNRELELVSSIFTLAITHHKAKSNPCKNVQKFAEDNERTRYLAPDEEERLLAQLEGSREYLKPIVLLAIHTGLRRNEIFSLEWSRVDFFRGVIYVTKTKAKRNRFVPMNEVVRTELLRLREQSDGNGLVFRSPKTRGKLVDIKKGFKAACEDAGIQEFR